MSFHHVPTFLKSALARDPFCLGGVISPEDVLRLESQFPALFDNPVESSGVSDNPVTESPQKKAESLLGDGRVTLVRQKDTKTVGANANRKGTGTPRKILPPRLSTTRPVPSQFHRNCLSSCNLEKQEKVKKLSYPPKRLANTLRQPPQSSSRGNRKLTRPAQSFSLENLRETLKQVMQDNEYKEKEQTKAKSSPYTEDLVRKFLGMKLQQMEKPLTSGAKKVKSPRVGKGENRGQGDAVTVAGQHKQQQKTVEIMRFETRNPQHKCVNQPKEKVQRVKSAPGFLRSFPQPIAALREQRKSKSAKEENNRKRENSEVKQVKWEEDQQELRDSRSYDMDSTISSGCNIQMSQVSVKQQQDVIEQPGILEGRRGTGASLLIRSQKPIQETIIPQEEERLPKSSFHHLLAARAVTSKYETKGLLRKQGISVGASLKHRMTNSYGSSLDGYKDDTASKMRHASNSSTRKVLEKLAEELVYTEILHQLNEIKRESAGATGVNNQVEMNEHDMNENFKFTSVSESESKGKSLESKDNVSEIILKTPELTPPTALKPRFAAHQNAARENDVDSMKRISLHTPELSPIQKGIGAIGGSRIPANIRSAPQHNVDTDCSEMSDFVFSEVVERDSSSIQKGSKSHEKIQLITPDLSKPIGRKNIKAHSRNTNTKGGITPMEFVKTPENEDSTLSGVSTFQEVDHVAPSHSRKQQDKQSEAEQRNAEVVNVNNPQAIKEEKRESIENVIDQKLSYSADDFLPEEVAVSGGCTGSYSFLTNDEDVDLNTSGETVIDLISEGEFIGDPHKSPGELSLREYYRRKLSANKNRKNDLSITSLTLESNDSEGEPQNSISLSSSGAQIPVQRQRATISIGEYLQP